jgi:hypothetical protein
VRPGGGGGGALKKTQLKKGGSRAKPGVCTSNLINVLPQVENGVNGNNANDDDDGDAQSDVSAISDLSGANWKPDAGPFSWVQKQMLQGTNPRSLLQDMLSKVVIERNWNFQPRPKPNIRQHCRYRIFGFGRIFGAYCLISPSISINLFFDGVHHFMGFQAVFFKV